MNFKEDQLIDMPARWPLIIWINGHPKPAYRSINGQLYHRQLFGSVMRLKRIKTRDELKLQWPWVMTKEMLIQEINRLSSFNVGEDNPVRQAYSGDVL